MVGRIPIGMKLTRAQIYYYAVKYQGDYRQMVLAIGVDEPYQQLKENELFITIVDECYPQALRLLTQPPLIIFYRGRLELLNQPLVAIVGSRDPSPSAQQVTRWIVDGINQRYGIINGFAKGIDSTAMQQALKHHRNVVMVMGCGLDICYPMDNSQWFNIIKNHQLMISEYPLQVRPQAKHFPFRNRIIVALSQVVIIPCAKINSGTMITGNMALEMDKPLWCVPNAIFEQNSEGCNTLIAQGANLIVNQADLKVI